MTSSLRSFPEPNSLAQLLLATRQMEESDHNATEFTPALRSGFTGAGWWMGPKLMAPFACCCCDIAMLHITTKQHKLIANTAVGSSAAPQTRSSQTRHHVSWGTAANTQGCCTMLTTRQEEHDTMLKSRGPARCTRLPVSEKPAHPESLTAVVAL